mmetsp:Transcript_18822/g.39346  ORF Transcript_18822/g.39346 Transcript_18822/m.39346 type:complete len:93 (-) Transcript_18822:77-355(-)
MTTCNFRRVRPGSGALRTQNNNNNNDNDNDKDYYYGNGNDCERYREIIRARPSTVAAKEFFFRVWRGCYWYYECTGLVVEPPATLRKAGAGV